MMDHATGIVIGETAVIESHVSIFQGVTLGGRGNEIGKRHPNIESGATIYASSASSSACGQSAVYASYRRTSAVFAALSASRLIPERRPGPMPTSIKPVSGRGVVTLCSAVMLKPPLRLE